MAAQGNHVEILQNPCVWTEEAQLCSNELKNKLLVLKNKHGYMVWLRGAENSSLDLRSGSGKSQKNCC